LVPLLNRCFASGLTLPGQGHDDAALATFEEGLDLSEKVGNEVYHYRLLNGLGWLYIELGDLDRVMVGSYDYRLVALSVLVSILAAYAARDLSERVCDARGRAWLAWLVGGAMAHGIGTWSMHYTGMLAFRLPVPVQHDWPRVLLSLLVCMIGSAAALFVVSRSTIEWPWAWVASVFLGGVGISGLHYTAMAAVRLWSKASTGT
jgi:hypothetical protein